MGQSSSSADIKSVYWVPNVSGGLVVNTIPQHTDWSLEYSQKPAQAAEKTGFNYALGQIRFTTGYGAEHQHESVSFSQAILYTTTKLKVLTAILPGPWHPTVVAKQLATINHVSNGRIAINVISDWFKGEFQALGEPWPEHDERYHRSSEFTRVLKGIWMQDKFTFKGDSYRINDYTLGPKPLQKSHPKIFQGGSSHTARDNVANVSDWCFTNGNTPEGVEAQIDDIQVEAREDGHTVRVSVNAFIIVHDAEEEARAMLDDVIKHAHVETAHAFGDAMERTDKASPEGKGNWAKSTFEDLVQYNDGFRTNLIGTLQQTAEHIVHLKPIGVDLILTGFLHFIEEVEYFGWRVLPLMCELETQRTATSGTTNADVHEAEATVSTT